MQLKFKENKIYLREIISTFKVKKMQFFRFSIFKKNLK